VIGAGPAQGGGSSHRLELLTALTVGDMDPGQLISELLRRLCEVLPADAATLMVWEPLAQQLVTTAAHGMSAHGRVSIGRGYAGHVAQIRQAMVWDHVDATVIANQDLRAYNPGSLAAVPMMAGGELLGVLVTASLKPGAFSEEHLPLLQVAADRAAAASQQQRDRVDHAAALALQRSLLPTLLPDVAGLDLSARYVPGHATGVGGDWYDVFRLPTGHVGLVVGDVAGHGLNAAVVMGRLRSGLRAFALDHDSPAQVLRQLDRKMTIFETGTMATVVYALVAPDRQTAMVSVAGHPPPVLATPSRPARLIDAPADPLLGTGAQFDRRDTVVRVPVGGLLVFYTDGLVERRNRSIREGLARLVQAVEAGPVEDVAARIMTLMDIDRVSDDIALLTVHRTS
jgi:putative methionine-R-sulfoxide reductase with GAF domain